MFWTVSAHVPSLGVYLINQSPRVTGDSVEAEFQITRPVTGVRCFLRSALERIFQNCKLPAAHMKHVSEVIPCMHISPYASVCK